MVNDLYASLSVCTVVGVVVMFIDLICLVAGLLQPIPMAPFWPIAQLYYYTKYVKRYWNICNNMNYADL